MAWDDTIWLGRFRSRTVYDNAKLMQIAGDGDERAKVAQQVIKERLAEEGASLAQLL